MDVRVHSSVHRQGYQLRTISFAGCEHYRVPAYLLVPLEGKPPYPGVVALHDHGGYFYHGKEKIANDTPAHAALIPFREQYYGGPPDFQKRIAGLKPGQPEYLAEVNRYLSQRTAELNTP